MGDRQTDPARLQGEDLRRWYLRTPEDIEREREAAATRRYREFFGGVSDGRVDPGFSRNGISRGKDIDPGFAAQVGRSGVDIDPGFDWAPAGPNRWPRQQVDETPAQQLAWSDSSDGAVLDRGLAGVGDGGQFIEVGNPAHPRLKKEWEQREGQPWPRDPKTGRPYDVAHIKALADGGTNTVENIRPLHPDAHRAEHVQNDDFGRWGRRPGIARAFGGTVARVLGPLGIVSDITGIMSGRIRTDNFDNFSSDMMGWPSQEDQRKALEEEQRQFNPKWKPGDPIIV